MRKKIQEKNFKKKIPNFEIYFFAPCPLFWAYLDISFVPGHRLKKIYSYKDNQLLYLPKKFQKIMIEYQPIDIVLPNIPFAFKQTMVLQGLILKDPRPFFLWKNSQNCLNYYVHQKFKQIFFLENLTVGSNSRLIEE